MAAAAAGLRMLFPCPSARPATSASRRRAWLARGPSLVGLPGPAVTPALLQANTRHMLSILHSIHQLDRHALYKMFSGREDWSTKADRMYVDFVRFFMQNLTADERKLLIGSVKNIIRGAQQI